MKKYEYRTEFIDVKESNFNLAVDMKRLEDRLNEVGSKGWKLCTTIKDTLVPSHLILVFEREVGG